MEKTSNNPSQNGSSLVATSPKNKDYNLKIRISRFTYFYQDMAEEIIKPILDRDTPEFKPSDECKPNTFKENFPFSKHFADIWEKEYDKDGKGYSKQIANTKTGEFIYSHFLEKLDKKIVVFEKIIEDTLGKAIDRINENLGNHYKLIIKQGVTDWHGDYTSDGDYFYLINVQVKKAILQKDDKALIKDIENLFISSNHCIFSQLKFEDKKFPSVSQLDKNLSEILDNEEQPLKIISSRNNQCKLLIVDEKLFIRCYSDDSDENRRAFPLRLVIITLLSQRAFLEYAAKMSANITNKKTGIRYKDLHQLFVVFMDNFWKLDMTNSYFLNKSYRIIGKVWLLNQRFELTKDHLSKNAIQESERQKFLLTRCMIIIGVGTLICNINIFLIPFDANSYISKEYLIIIEIIVGIFGLTLFFSWSSIRKKFNQLYLKRK